MKINIELNDEQTLALQRAQYRNGESLEHTLLRLAGLAPEPQRGAPVKDSMADEILRAEDERILRLIEEGE